MGKDYYATLGIKPEATPEEIKAAYRQQVKKLHPDYYGQESGPFRAVQEAYEVLSDPASRQAYDDELARRPHRRPDPMPAEPLRPRPVPVEPLKPEEPADSWIDPLIDPWVGRRRHRESYPTANKPAGFEVGAVEVELAPAQARRGGHVRLLVPVKAKCMICRGSGIIDFFYECPHCNGTGAVTGEYYVLAPFPAGITSTYTTHVSLDPLGLENAYVTVHFRRRVG